MYCNLKKEKEKLLSNIAEYEFLDKSTKERLIKYLDDNLFNRVYFYENNDFILFESLLKDYDYNPELLESMLNASKKIVNVTARKQLLPRLNLLVVFSDIFKRLDIDFNNYELDDELINTTLSKLSYRINVFKEERLNNEVSIIDFTNEIYNKYYSGQDINASKCKIIRILDSVNEGIKDLTDGRRKIFQTEEFLSLFECGVDLSLLDLKSIIKEFYPTFNNEIFLVIKRIAENSDYVDNNIVLSSLHRLQSKNEFGSQKKNETLNEVKNIDIDTSEKIKSVFSNLIENIRKNRYISDEIKNNILNNIDIIFDRYKDKQNEYLGQELNNVINNFTYFINNLIVPSAGRKTGIDSLVNECLNKCKDFFIEYDGKKFKEIVDYLLDNTSLTLEDLMTISDKCIKLFKEADIKKLKVINDMLKEFKEYANKFGEDLIEEDIFENIIINNPELLIKENNIKDIIKFLKGEISLKQYGYKSANIKLDKDLLGYKFFKKLKEENYEVLFNSSIERLISNLNYIEESCPICNINFRDLKINEDMIYMLLKNDFASNNNHQFFSLTSVFSSKDIKLLIENNPQIIKINEHHLDLIIEKCILNENEDYDFYDLLSSELFYYDSGSYDAKSDEEILNSNFKYINLNLEKVLEFDVSSILTSGLLSDDSVIDKIWDLYHKRNNQKEKLQQMLDQIEEEIPFMMFYVKVKEIFELYEILYSKVPNVTIKNRINDLISIKIDLYNYQKIDNENSIDTQKELLSIHEGEKLDGSVVKRELEKLLKTINSDVIRSDIRNFLNLTTARIGKSSKREQEISERIESIQEKINELSSKVELLEGLLHFSDDQNFCAALSEFNGGKYFTIEGLSQIEDEEKERAYIFEKLFEDNNLIVISNEAKTDLEDIPNDREIFDKVHKFLGKTQFSIHCKAFMEDKKNNADFVEKLKEPRNEIWARREGRTPVRVYFIPIHTKYFTCYYVTGVKYKDHNHLYGGCPSDEGYRRKVREAKALERKIAALENFDDIIDFIDKAREEYGEAMGPIVAKIDALSRKKTNTKK